MTHVPRWVQDLTEEVCGPNLIEIGKIYDHPQDGLIRIISGQYWGEFGLSNFWHWEVLDTKERHAGYGGSWKPVEVPEDRLIVGGLP